MLRISALMLFTGVQILAAIPDSIGIYRTSITDSQAYDFRAWMLDSNHNFLLDGSDSYNLYTTPMASDVPIVGDWNGDGRSKIGIFRDGFWVLDYNGNGVYDAGDKFYGFGQQGDKPMVGDWNGDGRTKIGVYRNGFWFLDFDGDGSYTGSDKFCAFGGIAASSPSSGIGAVTVAPK